MKPEFKIISDLINNCKDNYFIYQDQNPCLYGAEPHIHFKNEELDVHFDIVTGLYYRSSNDSNLFIKVNDELEKSMLKHKMLVDNIWLSQPMSEDELVHLACHCMLCCKNFYPMCSLSVELKVQYHFFLK